MKKKPVAVVIITNGPGELSTWVRPVVDHLNQINHSFTKKNRFDLSIRLVLVPCPNATGKEYKVANSWEKFDLITKASAFWQLLIKPSYFADWPKKGIVIFLGGDQFWGILLAKRFDGALKNDGDVKVVIDTFDFSVIRDVVYELVGEQR